MSTVIESDINAVVQRVRTLIAEAERYADVEVVNLLVDAEWALKDAAALLGEAVDADRSEGSDG